jgi:hypothetical protein
MPRNNKLFIIFIIANFFIQIVHSQSYTRRNSPYSRYGLGDLFNTQFASSMSTGGGLNATYNSFWDYNPSNPASLGHIQNTVFDVGVFYKHSILDETQTNLSSTANDGNLTYLSIAFPITKSWEIEEDTLRKAIPIQWGMGLSLMPHSTVGYDTRIKRELTDIGSVEYKYTGEGSRFRVNWSNGWRYKGLSVGANLALLFGTTNNKNVITFEDSTYTFSYNERELKEENALGFLWDIGVQYDLYVKKASKKPDPFKDSRITFGTYLNGAGNMRILSKSEVIRYGTYYGIDTLLITDDSKSYMKLPLGIGAGISFVQGLKWKFGINYETQFWNNFSYSERNISMANSYTVAAGIEFIPDYLDFKNYLKRIRYRLGAFYGTDPRIVGSGANNYQLSKYGINFGLGLQMKPRKSSILGHAQIGFEFGYLGHPELIKEQYFQVNVAFSLNDNSWFIRSKFR